jgi:hypothetical protein
MFSNVHRHEPTFILPRTQQARWSRPIRVLSMDDDPPIHEGIRALLSKEDDLEACGLHVRLHGAVRLAAQALLAFAPDLHLVRRAVGCLVARPEVKVSRFASGPA